MAHDQRAVLAGACAVPALRHPSLEPRPGDAVAAPGEAAVFMDPGLRRDDEGVREARWARALARYARAEAEVEGWRISRTTISKIARSGGTMRRWRGCFGRRRPISPGRRASSTSSFATRCSS